MAYAPAAILTRIHEVLDDGAGSVRTVSSTRFNPDLYTGLEAQAQALRALVKPIFDVEILHEEPSADTPMDSHSMAFKQITVRVTVVRAGTLAEKLTESTRIALKALAYEDADLIKQALLQNQNLTQTTAAAATGLISGRLREHIGSDHIVDFSGPTSARIVTTHDFYGDVNVTQPVA